MESINNSGVQSNRELNTHGIGPICSEKGDSGNYGQNPISLGNYKEPFYLEKIAKGIYYMPEDEVFNNFIKNCKDQYAKTSSIFYKELNSPQQRPDIQLNN